MIKLLADAWFLWLTLGLLALVLGAPQLGGWILFGTLLLVLVGKFILPPPK